MSAEPYTEAEIEDQRAYVSQEFDLYAAHVERNRRWLATVDSLRAELAEAKAMVLARFHPVPVTAADLAQAREFIEPYERGRLAGIEQARELLLECARWMQDGRSLHEWEDIAEWFGTETRMLRPGKDQPMRMGGRPTDEERQARFDKWCGDKKAEIRAKIAAALSSPAAGSGGSPQSASPEGDGSPRPTVVTLCGSTRFYDAFRKAEYEEGLVGRIVLTVGFSVHRSDAAHGETVGCTPEQKIKLDELHKRKIDLSDEILVLNVGGYVGSSTRGEIEYARKTGKLIRWLEPRGESPTPEGEGDRSPPCVECAGTGDKHPGVYPSCDRFCCRCKRCAGTGKEPRGESPKPATEGGSAK